MMKKTIQVQGANINVLSQNENDFISLTDMSSKFGGSALIEKWLRNKNTIEFLGVWETLYNPNFNSPEFEGIKNQAGLNRFVLSVKQWIGVTKAMGLIAKAGRYGGTYAHKDIAFEFGSWLSPEFKLYLIREFQRLKEEEAKRLNEGWHVGRALAAINYKIHTDSVREHLIPPKLSKQQQGYIYASEADVLNKAVFGLTAKEWRQQNSQVKNSSNIRDHARVEQLIVISNLESINALLIEQGMSQQNRLMQLNQVAISQMKALTQHYSKSKVLEKKLKP
jgi:hypothetical protein